MYKKVREYFILFAINFVITFLSKIFLSSCNTVFSVQYPDLVIRVLSASAQDPDPTFWLPGSRSTKLCGSTDPDPSVKLNFELLRKEIFKNYHISLRCLKFQNKNKRKIRGKKPPKLFLCSINQKILQKNVQDLNQDPFSPLRIYDPDPHQNQKDPKHCCQLFNSSENIGSGVETKLVYLGLQYYSSHNLVECFIFFTPIY